jgi:hypothetical protein
VHIRLITYIPPKLVVFQVLSPYTQGHLASSEAVPLYHVVELEDRGVDRTILWHHCILPGSGVALDSDGNRRLPAEGGPSSGSVARGSAIAAALSSWSQRVLPRLTERVARGPVDWKVRHEN